MKPAFRTTLFAITCLTVATVGRGLAQETNSTPDATEADREALASNIVTHIEAVAQTNETAASNDLSLIKDVLSETNIPLQTNMVPQEATQTQADNSRSSDSRSNRRRSGRDSISQSKGARSDRAASSDGKGRAETSNNGARPDFSTFRIVAERNIFDPNRRRSSGPRERPKTVESISLVGIMSYDKGTFAFFDGSSSSYRKALKQNDTIAGYRVDVIDPSHVVLVSGTNQVDLRVGMQLRREEEGAWNVSRQPETFTASSAAASSTSTTSTPTTQTDSATSAGESDVLKRLRERREKE